VALNARLRGGIASERRLGEGNGQGADGPEADREHAARGPVRRLREGGPSSPTHRASARDRGRVHRRPSRHLQGRPGPGGPGHGWPRRRTMSATHADRRLRATPRSVAPGLSRPRSEQAPYCRLCAPSYWPPYRESHMHIMCYRRATELATRIAKRSALTVTGLSREFRLRVRRYGRGNSDVFNYSFCLPARRQETPSGPELYRFVETTR
jgi:hypothetical protein